ncbi:hypothetical protein ACWGDE_31735 [Streptomyces sp. NPDC054956]
MDRGGNSIVEIILPGIGPADRAEVVQPSGVRRVSGDRSAGVYRTDATDRTDGSGEADGSDGSDGSDGAAPEPEIGVVREVYDWATLTIGGARRALWLFLVPFLLLNTVAWLQPFGLERRWATRVYQGAARLVGLTLTVLAVATCAEVAMDQLVWQCGRLGICDRANPAVRALAGLGTGWGLVAAVAVPGGALTLIAFTARDGKREYQPLMSTRYDDADARDEERRPLQASGFWEVNPRAAGLACRHLCAGALTLALLLAEPAFRGGGERSAGWLLFAAMAGLGLLVVCGGPWWRVPWADWALGAACGLVLAGAAAYAAGSPFAGAGRRLPGMGALVAVLLAVQGGVLLALAVGSVWAAGARRRQSSLYGATGAALGVVACFAGWVCSAALMMWSREWLTQDGAETGVVLPRAVQAVSMALPLLLAALVVAAPFVGVVFRVKRWRRERSWPPLTDEEGRESARRAQELRSAEDRAGKVKVWVGRVVGVCAVGAVAAVGGTYGFRLKWLTAYADLVIAQLNSMGAVILVGLVAVMVIAVRAMVLQPQMRRNAGMMWAIGAFWPRAAHPFTPATWTGRSVPELVHRLRHLTGGPRERVLLHGHSMGAVLGVLALWQLEPERRARVALLTSGCPLRSYFARYHPAFFTEVSLRAPAQEGALVRWANTWRTTDPMGGPLTDDPVRDPQGLGPGVTEHKWEDGVDPGDPAEDAPPVLERSAAHPVFPPLQGHDNYRTDARTVGVRRSLIAALAAAGLPGPRTPV